MKKILLILIALPLTLFCQQTEKTKLRRIAMGVVISPDACYRSLKADNTANAADIVEIRNGQELPNLGYSFGAAIKIDITKRFGLESQLLYVDRGWQTDWYQIQWISQTPTQNDPSIPEIIKFIYHFKYLSVPVKARVDIIAEKVQLFVSGGLSADIYIGGSVTTKSKQNDGKKNTTHSNLHQANNTVNASGMLSLGTGFDLGNRFNLRVESMYKRSFVPLLQAPIKEYSYTAGLNIALFFKL